MTFITCTEFYVIFNVEVYCEVTEIQTLFIRYDIHTLESNIKQTEQANIMLSILEFFMSCGPAQKSLYILV
jgi:hypothetical protein